MIDLHIHLLPDVDDGPGTVEESLEMIRMAAVSGCTDLVATPHQRRRWSSRRRELESRLETLRAEVGESPRLHLGAEVHGSDGVLTELGRENRGELLPLAGSSYLLLELPVERDSRGAQDLVHEIALLGLRPILAHPEFIPVLADDPDLVASLVRGGALVQITAMCLTGEVGRRAQRTVGDLLDRGLVHFVASDAHSPTWRPPGLDEARRTIAGRWGRALADRLLEKNPAAVLADAPIEATIAG